MPVLSSRALAISVTFTVLPNVPQESDKRCHKRHVRFLSRLNTAESFQMWSEMDGHSAMGSGLVLGIYFGRFGMDILRRVDSNPQFYKSGSKVGSVYPQIIAKTRY